MRLTLQDAQGRGKAMRAVACTFLLLFGVGVVALNYPDAESQGTLTHAAQLLTAPAKEDRLALWPIERIGLVKMTWSLKRDTDSLPFG